MNQEVISIVSLFTPIILAVVGFGVSMVLHEVRSMKDDMREAREEHREFVRKEECRLHRAEILRKIESGCSRCSEDEHG